MGRVGRVGHVGQNAHFNIAQHSLQHAQHSLQHRIGVLVKLTQNSQTAHFNIAQHSLQHAQHSLQHRIGFPLKTSTKQPRHSLQHRPTLAVYFSFKGEPKNCEYMLVYVGHVSLCWAC